MLSRSLLVASAKELCARKQKVVYWLLTVVPTTDSRNLLLRRSHASEPEEVGKGNAA